MTSSKDVLRALKADGWVEVRQKGSHIRLKHPTKPGSVTVAHPYKDVPIGTLRAIENQSGVTLTKRSKQ
jgi:predicted RNA binding protein YcfA (HicA-like mRNA interferase family)